MVFHCRCFSSLLEQDEEFELETVTQTKSTIFYTASSEPNQSALNPRPEISNLAVKFSNLRVFTVAELNLATENFCRKIGKGGFGSVYKGVIKSLEFPFDDIHVAVKLAKELLQRYEEWEAEINVLGVVDHPNLVKLIGYCAEDNESDTQLFLVYEYMIKGSLRDHLFAKSSTSPLSWNMRLKVAQDTARGLTYLHEEMNYQIIFRDFKSSNILLDEQWNAKLSDFGLARLGPPEGLTHVSTAVVGTMGYAAPEYIQTGYLTSKYDVWSYGVFLYELITGRRSLGRARPNEQKLLEWVKPHLDSKRFQIIIDPRLEGKYSLKSALKLSIIANKCLCRNPKSRPKMSEVLEMVNQLIGDPSQATDPASHTNLAPVVAIEPKNVFVGPIGAKKTVEDMRTEVQKGPPVGIQHKKSRRFSRLWVFC